MSQTAVPTPARTDASPAGPGAIMVSRADLPLACPRPGDTLWSMHPRVYLPIENEPDHASVCPYCGAYYRLRD